MFCIVPQYTLSLSFVAEDPNQLDAAT